MDGAPRAALRIDGAPADFPADLVPGSPWYYGRAEFAARALVPPGSHNVTVDLPAHTPAALLIYEAGSQ